MKKLLIAVLLITASNVSTAKVDEEFCLRMSNMIQILFDARRNGVDIIRVNEQLKLSIEPDDIELQTIMKMAVNQVYSFELIGTKAQQDLQVSEFKSAFYLSCMSAS